MRETEILIERAVSNGIVLWTADGQLRFRAPRGSMSAQLRQELAERRSELIAMLSGPLYRAGVATGPTPILAFYRDLWTKIRTGALDVTFTNAPHWLIRVEGELDKGVLEATVRNLAEQHPILAARVLDGREGPSFVFDRKLELHFLDLSHADDSEERLAAAISEIVWKPFDPHNEAFFRPFAISISARTYVLGFVLHHLIGDAWSVTNLTLDLLSAYEAAKRHMPLAPREQRLQYTDYVIALNRWVHGPALAYRLGHWRKRMTNAPATRLPPDRDAEPSATGVMRAEIFSVGVERTRALRAVSAELGVTLFTVFAAAKACALRSHLASGDLVLLSMFHGRDDPRLSNVVGSMQNQIPLRISMDLHASFVELVKSIQETCSNAYAYQVPYHYIRQMLPAVGVAEQFAELNFQDRLAHANGRQEAVGKAALEVTPLSVGAWPVSTMKAQLFPAHSLIVSATTQLSGVIVYLDCIYERESIVGFLTTLHRILDAVALDPRRTVAQLMEC